MFSHMTKKTKQLCYQAAWWPSEDSSLGPLEKRYPLMMFASGQCNRVNANNLIKISQEGPLNIQAKRK